MDKKKPRTEKAALATIQKLQAEKTSLANDEAEDREKRKAERVALAKEMAGEIRIRMITLVTTALALVAGLFWQTAINDTIKTFIPVSGAWQYEVVVALAVTIAAAIAIYLLSKPTNKPDKPADKG